MDKETLSNYGWIVICVMVLAVMIALATPFGGFIRDAVWSTTNGLFDVQNEALNAAGIVTGGSQPGAEESQPSTVSGSYISVNDVESANQPLTVSLTSNSVSDFSSVKVTRYGSNLIDISQMLNNQLTDNGDGTYTLTATTEERKSGWCNVDIPANVPFFLRAIMTENETTGDYCVYAQLYFEDGTTEVEIIAVEPNMIGAPTMKDIFSYSKAITKIRILLRFDTDGSYVDIGDYITIKELKLNIGQEWEYEAYKQPQTVSANSDGSVTGLTSTAPGMTIMTDNENVTITCDYKKKQ